MQLNYKELFEYGCIISAYCFVFVLGSLNFLFFKYHIKLVLTNSTTIEALDPESLDRYKYDISIYENWVQVFGQKKIYWLFPVLSENARPVGDGLHWRTASFIEKENKNKHLANVSNIVNSTLADKEMEEKQKEKQKTKMIFMLLKIILKAR